LKTTAQKSKRGKPIKRGDVSEDQAQGSLRFRIWDCGFKSKETGDRSQESESNRYLASFAIKKSLRKLPYKVLKDWYWRW
jgi:hypothetical protein